jgi:hypothetical protein
MVVQWEQDHSGAVESFLLPDLAATTPYPKRAKYLPPDRWVLIDPESDVPPMLVALTRKKPSGFSHYLVGVADWPEGTVRAHGEFWHTFTPKERAEIERMWTGLERTK